MRLLRSSQAAVWKKFRFLWRIATSGLHCKAEHFDLQFRLEYCFYPTSVYKLPSSSFPSRFLSDVTRQRDWNFWLLTSLQRVHLSPIFPFPVPQLLKDYYPSTICVHYLRGKGISYWSKNCVKTLYTSVFLIIVFKEILGYLYVANIWFPIIIPRDIFVWGGYFMFENKK